MLFWQCCQLQFLWVALCIGCCLYGAGQNSLQALNADKEMLEQTEKSCAITSRDRELFL